MPFTVIEMVDIALEQAGLDSSFQTMGKSRLKLILEDEVRNFNFPFLRKVAAKVNFLQGQNAYALPTDFSRSDTCYLANQNGRASEINIYDQTEFDRLRTTGTDGLPSISYINQLDSTIVFESAPAGGDYGYILTYFKTDLNIDVAGNTTNNSVPGFQDQAYLIKKLTETMFEFLDDQRYEAKRTEARDALRASKMNSFDTDQNPTVTLATPYFRPGRRPPRGG